MELGPPWRLIDTTGTSINANASLGGLQAEADCIWYDAMHNHWMACYCHEPTSGDQGATATFGRFSIPALGHRLLARAPSMVIPLPPCWCRIPLLVKLSLDQKVLAIQRTTTQVRIVPLTGESKHWTIDLAVDATPQSSHPTGLPKQAAQARLKLQNPAYILNGGMYWTDHGGTSQDLLLCTDKGLFFYKISAKKGMSATHSFPQSSNLCWMEPVSRTLLVGSKALQGYSMRGFRLQAEPKQSHFPRLEVPPPDRLPTFSTNVEWIELVSLYGKTYCVQIDVGQVRLKQLVPASERPDEIVNIKDFQPSGDMFFSVIDDLFNIHFRKSKTTVLIDIQDKENPIMIDDSRRITDEIYRDDLVMSARSYIQGKDVIYPLILNLQKVRTNWPQQKCIIPFLLRRIGTESAHTLALQELVELLHPQNGRLLRQEWLDAVADVYQENRVVWHLDCIKSCELLAASALLPSEPHHVNVVKGREQASISLLGLSQWNRVLSQSSILEIALLPAAKQAVDMRNEQHLRNILDFAVDLTGALSRHDIAPVPALRCLLAALLWRLGHSKELMALLKSSASQPVAIYEPNSGFAEGSFAEMVLAIVSETNLDCGTSNELKQPLPQQPQDSTRAEIFLLLVSSMPRQRAAQHLLASGRLLDAISVCTKIVNFDLDDRNDGDELSDSRSLPSSMNRIIRGADFFRVALECSKIPCHDLSTRCRLFFHLYNFLLLWDPDCLKVQSREVAPLSMPTNIFLVVQQLEGVNMDAPKNKRRGSKVVTGLPLLPGASTIDGPSGAIAASRMVVNDDDKIYQMVMESALAHQFPTFPDDLFGGQGSDVCIKVRTLFGYRNS